MDDETFEKLRIQREAELKAIIESPRTIGVYIVTPNDACPLCRWAQGTYYKDNPEQIPVLPLEGCSRPGGCISRYEPLV
ncbi:MAG: hypothetical protein ACFB51_16465 [Anaerolineae bacterium]